MGFKISTFIPPSNLLIRPLADPSEICELAADGTADRQPMVVRLVEEWRSGLNRFDKPGERAYIAIIDEQVCGVCGLNIDPFANDARVGRVRRLYISRVFRRRGVASAIMQQLVHDAAAQFREVQLRTHNLSAALFYEAVGFVPVAGKQYCTHRLNVLSAS